MTSYTWPPNAGTQGIPIYSTFSALPSGQPDGSQGVTADTDTIYIYNAGSATWIDVGSPGSSLTINNFGSAPNAAGGTISGGALTLQPADATHPGGLSITTQTIAGNKTFSGSIAASNFSGTFSGSSSGTNTGDQTISLTGDVSGSGTGSFGTTLATVNSNVGSFTNASISVNGKGLVTAASSGSAPVLSLSVASANGLAGSSSGGQTPALTLSTSVTGILQGNGTAISAATTTGSGSVVLATAPTLSNPVVGTQSQGDGSTKGASTAYVDTAVANAVAGVNPAVAVQAATTVAGDTSGLTYNNGASGIGATFTGSTNTALVIDGFTFTSLGQRLLVKNDTQSPSGAFNGVYYVTQVQTSLLPPILTRALDYDQPSDMNNTGAIPVISGTVNGTTQWVLSSLVVTVGTTALVFTQFSKAPSAYLTIPGSFTNHGVVIGTGTQATSITSAGSAGQVLTSNGSSSDPTYQTVTVQSNNTSGERVERAYIANNGTASITSQSGSWLSSVSRNGAGDVTVNIAGGMFSAAPSVHITCLNGASRLGQLTSATALSATVFRVLTKDSTFANVDSDFMIIAMGPR